MHFWLENLEKLNYAWEYFVDPISDECSQEIIVCMRKMLFSGVWMEI